MDASRFVHEDRHEFTNGLNFYVFPHDLQKLCLFRGLQRDPLISLRAALTMTYELALNNFPFIC